VSRLNRRSSRRGPQPGTVQTAGVLTPARAGFDFLDGAFRSDERARVKGLAALGSTGMLLVAVAFGGVLLGTRNAATVAQLAEANRQVSTLSVELGQLSNTGGLGEQDLAARLQVLQGQLDQVDLDQVQVLTIVNALQSALPPGAQITSIELKRSDAGLQLLTVQVALEAFSRLTALSDGFASIWYLREPAISWTSSADRVAVTFKANIDPALVDGPVARLRTQIDAALAGAGPSAPAPTGAAGERTQDTADSPAGADADAGAASEGD
jgi:hypothetical protein